VYRNRWQLPPAITSALSASIAAIFRKMPSGARIGTGLFRNRLERASGGTVQRNKSLCWWFTLTLCVTTSAVRSNAQVGPLPYDQSNHVWYDNDFTSDYMDWYVMAVASSDGVVLRGITTTTSESGLFDELAAGRSRIVADGLASGFRNVPTPLPGADRALDRPGSRSIEDTAPVVTAGTLALIEAAHQAYAETGRPLVVCVGGPLTSVASAYLSDPTIAEKVIVAFVDNYDTLFGGYNGGSDPWAAYIALQRLPLVYFPIYPDNALAHIPRLAREWILNVLPPSPARDHMSSLQLDVINESDGDADGMSAVSMLVPYYVRAVRRVSFGGWSDAEGPDASIQLPTLREDGNGTALVVTQLDEVAAGLEYQRAFLNWVIWRSLLLEPTPQD
jgi:hypothetical protein